MDIRSDESILSIYLRCSECAEIYNATEDEDHEYPLCENCNAGKEETNQTICFDTLPASGYSSLLPYQVPQVRDFLQELFTTPPNVVVDASAHIGGDTIHFSTIWPECKIISIDNDQKAIECLRRNVKNFSPNPENIEIICDDCTTWIPVNMKKADFYYFDPPWGGPKYCSESEVSLFLSDKPIAEIINFVLDNNLSSTVILKAPRNFAYKSFKKEIREFSTRLHYIRKPQKRGSIAYSLILIRNHC